MKIRMLSVADVQDVMSLFYICFKDDHFYRNQFGGQIEQRKMNEMFSPVVKYCLENGFSYGVTSTDGELISFVLCFDYKAVKENSPSMFNEIFGADEKSELPYYEKLHCRIEDINGSVLYVLSIAVAPEYRKADLASGMIDYLVRRYPSRTICSDISNEASLEIYRRREFRIDIIEEGYFSVARRPTEPVASVSPIENMLVLPDCEVLEKYGVTYRMVKKRVFMVGFQVGRQFGIPFFVPSDDEVSVGCLVGLSYDSLLQYQRVINLCHYTETAIGNYIMYVQECGYQSTPLLNDLLSEMIHKRSSEWSIISDLYVSIPIEYTGGDLPVQSSEHSHADYLLKCLEFRTYYEVGVPSKADKVDSLASMKNRIKRCYLGRIRVMVSTEPTMEHSSGKSDSVGPASMVDVFLSIDKGSNCGVLTAFSMSTPFLLSHFLDNVSRNQLVVVDEDANINFFDFLKAKFGVIKQGTPKSYVVIPKKRTCLTPSQIASLLCAETIYPDGESFGNIIDSDLLSLASSEYGMGQYDRAYVAAYSNVVLQFSDNLIGSVRDRLSEESITLFYIELLLFEEAAIHIADRSMIRLSTGNKSSDPIEFLEETDKIYDAYSKTSDFWDIKVNYPSSQKSVEMLRKAFRTDYMLERMKRSQEHLQTVYDTKSDIIDRRNAKRMDVSLAIISFLAVFSAWQDGNDYIATWSDVFSPAAIHIMQRILFVLVFATAIYALAHLIGNRFSLHLKIRRARQQRHRKHWRKR